MLPPGAGRPGAKMPLKLARALLRAFDLLMHVQLERHGVIRLSGSGV